jgi:hypothetical protein
VYVNRSSKNVTFVKTSVLCRHISSLIRIKYHHGYRACLYLVFGLTAITNEPLELGL